ncbi:copper homeostasis membrane protein CopD [Sphingobium xenophagum]|uniref:copper homeostasis membrane protein CopD n=1 Tax=Sphingobium xenophagum TaxID=121428 RepID=UPI00241D6EDF|nr:copper homeostasis membrane protein CopD [Sphingobium xenophagum]
MLLLARFGLMADLALLMGLPLFWWAMDMAGQRVLLAGLALGGMLLSALWLLASAASMAGTPMLPPDWATAKIVLTMTPIGPVLAVRGGALLAALGLAIAGRDRWVLVPAAIAAATMAWTGHAGASEHGAGAIHRIADVAHIWAASGWIGALAALLYAATRRHPPVDRIAGMLAKFSLLGTMFVSTLIVTGAVNAAMIVGVADMGMLTGSRYGWLLGAKLVLFCGMLALAGINRWRLTPALERGEHAIAALRLSLCVETSAAIGILALVAWLGTLDPLA